MVAKKIKIAILILIILVLAMFAWVIKLEYQIRDLQCDIKKTQCDIKKTVDSIWSGNYEAEDHTCGEVNIIRRELIRKLQTAPYRLDLDSMRLESYDEGIEDRELKELMMKLLQKLQ